MQGGEWDGDLFVPFDPNKMALDEKTGKLIKNPRPNLSNRLKEIQGVYDQVQGEGSVAKIQQGANNKPADRLTDPETAPYTGIGNNVAVGLNRAYEGLLKIPRLVYSAAAVPQNFLADQLNIPELGAKYENFLSLTNTPASQSPLTMLDQLGDYYGEQSEGYATKTQKYDDNIIGSITKGNFKQAGSQILDQIAESAPSIAVMAMTSGAGNVAGLSQTSKTLANALPFMSQRNAELQGNENMPEWLKPINAAANGLSEVIFDQSFGTQAAIQGIVNRVVNEGREDGVKLAADFAQGFLNKAIAPLKAIKPFVNGAIEEGSTQLAQNIVDKYTLDPNKDLMEGVADAMIVGSAMTGGLVTAGNIALPKQRTQVRELETQQQALLNELGNENLSPESREGISKIIEDNQSTIESIAKETQEAIAKLSPAQKKEVEALNEKVTSSEAIVNDPNASDEVKKVAETQIESITKEIDAIKPEEGETKTKPKEPTGTPVKKGTDVAIDDTIELVNGKKGRVTKVEGDQVTMTMENGATFMATPELVEMSVIKPIEAPQETQTPEVAQEPTEVKEVATEPVIGVDEVYDTNDAIKNLGDKKEYDSYVKKVFPKSKVNVVMYHDTNKDFDLKNFDNNRTMYFTSAKQGHFSDQGKTMSAVVNLVNPKYVDADEITRKTRKELIKKYEDEGYDGLIATPEIYEQRLIEDGRDPKDHVNDLKFPEVLVFNRNQIHELGSESDIQGFKEYKNKANEGKPTTEEVVTEDISEKRTKEVLGKANTDLEALKQVQNKPAKYKASVKRLDDAYKAREISKEDYNEAKQKFDDVITDSSPNVPKKETLTTEEITSLDKELANQNLTTDDFIQYERTRAIADANNAEEVVQQPENDGAGVTGEVKPSETAQKAGDPIRAFAEKVRAGKINKLGGFKASTGFDGAWDLGIEAVALSLEGGAKVADAIQSGLQAIKKTDWYKGLENKDEFDSKYQAHMESEYDAEEKQSKSTTGINQTNIDATREELGLEEVKRLRKADAERNSQADKWVEDGNSIPDLLKRLEKGGLPTDVENVVLRKYISSLEARNNKNPTAELLADINRATKVVTESRSELGRALRAGVGEVEVVDNLSNFLLDEMDSLGIDSMPQSMIDELKAKYLKAQTAKEAWEAGYQKALDEFTKQQAQIELDKVRKERIRKTGKKTKADYQSERQSYKESIRRKLKEARSQANAVPVPYLAELIAISPDVAKLVRSYVEEGINNLDDIIKKVHTDLTEDIPDITEEDVRDLIAGQYKQKRPTRNEISAQVRDMQTQAKLLKRIEELENGVQPTTEVAKIQRSKQIDSLMKQVKEIEDRVGVTDAKTLKARRTSLENKIAQLKEDLETGNFDLEPAQPRKLKLDPETQAALDEYNEFLKETYKRRDRARYEQLSKWRKGWDYVQQVLGLRRLIQTSLDFSMPFRQAITVTLNPRQYGIGFKNFSSLDGLYNTPSDIKNSPAIQSWINMFRGFASEKYFDRVMSQIKSDPDYRNMMEDKLVFSEVDSADNLRREEDYRTSFLYKIPYLNIPFLASNRAAAGFVNTARYEMYKNGVVKLERQGITRENSPESYRALAKWAMNATGRGNMLEFLENSPQAQRILGDTFYGVRLMSSRFNLLNPNYYAKMPKEVRVEALKDMASFASTLAVTFLAASAAGATVSLNPDDSDFLKAKWGNKRYDLSGGMSQYMRTFFRLLKAGILRVNPKIYGENRSKVQLNKANKYGAFSVKSGVNFFRYKLAPNTSYVLSGIMGKDPVGEEFDPSEILNVWPMYYEDLREALKKGEGGVAGLTVVLPNLLGVGVQEYDNKKK